MARSSLADELSLYFYTKLNMFYHLVPQISAGEVTSESQEQVAWDKNKFASPLQHPTVTEVSCSWILAYVSVQALGA